MPRFRGGYFGFGGGGECRFYFYGREDFSEHRNNLARLFSFFEVIFYLARLFLQNSLKRFLGQLSGVDKRVVFQKGGFGGCSPGTKTGNEGTFECSPGTKTRTRVRPHVPPERKPERGYIRQNHRFTKPPFSLPAKMCVNWKVDSQRILV